MGCVEFVGAMLGIVEFTFEGAILGPSVGNVELNGAIVGTIEEIALSVGTVDGMAVGSGTTPDEIVGCCVFAATGDHVGGHL